MIVIIPMNNQLIHNQKVVNSIIKSKDDKKGVRIILVDNASGDKTGEYIDKVAKDFDYFEAVHNKVNGWFTDTNIVIIEENKGEDIFLLNNDTEVFDGWLSGREELKDWGAIGVTQLHPERHRLITFAGGLDDFSGHKRMWQWREEEVYKGIHQEKWLTGAGLMINREAYDKIGGFDSELKHYCQDSDLSVRLIKAGYKIGVSPKMRMVHYAGATTRAKSKDNKILEQGLKDQKRFAKKHKIQIRAVDGRVYG